MSLALRSLGSYGRLPVSAFVRRGFALLLEFKLRPQVALSVHVID